jgi:nicotinate dehydrogenase subunit B
MTGFMHERELSRKSFLKGGGALVVGFSLAGAGLTGKASAAAPTSAGYLPDKAQVDSWLTINPDNTATLKTSQIEVGNGITTGYLMLIAEELDMDLSQLYYGTVSATRQPVIDSYAAVSSGGEGGSSAISRSGTGPRAAAVAARGALLGLASKQLGAPASSLSVKSGVVSGGGKSVTYGDLVGGKLFNTTIDPASLLQGQSPAKPLSSYTLVGTSPPRIDIPAKVNGTYTYVHNIRLPGMLHGRVVRPRGQGAVSSTDYVPLSIDKSSVAHIPNVQIVQVGNFLGVVAPKEYDAIQAASQLKVTWQSDPLLSGTGNFWKNGRAQADAAPAKYTANIGNVDAALAGAAHTVAATFTYPFNGHLPIGPSCAVADVTATGATIFCNPQSIEGIPTSLAAMAVNGQPVLGLAADQIRAIFYEGSASYGDAPATSYDPAQAAAIMSKVVGAPVRLQFMRWDEHGYDYYGPPVMYDVKAGADASGNIVGLDWVSYTQGGASVTPATEAIGAATWPPTPAVGAAGTSDTIYKVATTAKRILAKSFPLYNGYLRSSYLRAPGAQQSHFAGEQVVDMLAHAANMDPIAFRTQNIDGTQVTGARWLAAMNAAAQAAGWQAKVANSVKQTGTVAKGRGFAFGTFASTQVAIVADVNVTMKTGKIVTEHLYIAHNNGFTVNPDLVANQMTGAAIQGLSRALYEEVTFSKERVTSLDWVGYPILRFADSPNVTAILVTPSGGVTVPAGGAGTSVIQQNADATSKGWLVTGAGEPASVPPAAAVANAFFDATGVRLFQAPMTPGRVRAAMKAAGVV